MKTAVSIPDDLYARAERLARRTKRSRSRLFSEAIGEYLSRHDTDAVTEMMNAAMAALDRTEEPFVHGAASLILEQTEW